MQINPRDCLQQLKLLFPGLKLPFNTAVKLLYAFAKIVILANEVPKYETVGVIELHAQRFSESVQFCGHVRTQGSQYDATVKTLEETFHNTASVHAEHIGDDPPDTYPASVKNFLNPVARPGALRNELAAMTAHTAQVAKQLRRNVAGTAEGKLTDPGEPYAVGHIGLSAPELLYLFRVYEQRPYPRPLIVLTKGKLPSITFHATGRLLQSHVGLEQETYIPALHTEEFFVA